VRFGTKLLLLALLALGVRGGYVLLVERDQPLTGDAFYYHEAANLLADGKGFIDPYRYVYGGAQERIVYHDANIPDTAATDLPPGHEEPTAGHPPAWTVTLAFFSLLGLRSELAHQLISVVIGAGGVALIGLAAREVARGATQANEVARGATRDPDRERAAERTGLIAAGVAAVYAFLFMNDGLVMSETIVIPVVAACTLAAMRFWREPTTRNAVVFGALGGLAPLTRAELVLYLPVVAAIALWRSPWRPHVRTRLARYATCAIAAIVVLAPWVGRNLTAFDKPVLISNGFGTVLVQTNCDATYGGQKLGYWELYCGLPQPLGPNGEPLDESERDAVLRTRGLDYLRAHKARFLSVAVPARIGRMFALYDPVQTIRFDIVVEGRSFRLSALGLAQYYPLLALAAFGTWTLARRRDPIAPAVTWIGIVVLTAATSFGNNRYRVSCEPAIVMLAAVGIHRLYALLGGSRLGRGALAPPARAGVTSGTGAPVSPAADSPGVAPLEFRR
jgi:hypothetical protein